MSTNGVSCELVDQDDLDTRYLAGRLSEQEAEAFEEHFFGCERCWDLVQQGLAVQAAGSPAAPAVRPGTRARIPPQAWWGLAAAAVLLLVVVGTRRSGPGPNADIPSDHLRGGVEAFRVTPGATRSAMTAVWPRVADADIYRVRLFTPDGTLLLERETEDTAFVLPADSLPAQTTAFWEVQALDPVRGPLARSELTRALMPSAISR